jgi:hypothetical protein
MTHKVDDVRIQRRRKLRNSADVVRRHRQARDS